MHAILFGLLILLLNVVDVSAHSYYTNEPAGSRPIASCNFNTSDLCGALKGSYQQGRFYDLYNNTPVITDGSEPASPSGAIDSILDKTRPCVSSSPTIPLDCAEGGGQVGYTDTVQDREFFVGLTFKINADYSCSRTGQSKTFFVRAGEAAVQTNGVFMISGCGSVKTFYFAHNTGGIDNSHTCSLGLGLACYPNVGSGALTAGVWYKIEVCIRASSSNTARDGVVKWWMNGNLVGSYTNINYGGGVVNEWLENQTWDGYYNGQSFTTASHQMFGDVHISNPPNGGCAGVPIVTDTIAPTQVTGVAVTSVAASTIGLSWNPSNDNVGIAGYNVEMCTGQACTTYVAKQSTTGTGTTVVITGLSPATPYSFRLKARDASWQCVCAVFHPSNSYHVIAW
jgi:hypothetical protein